MARREFLQLAKTYDLAKSKVGGWYISDKLDGTRCFWDGGITRGMKTELIPYASVLDPKTGKRKAKIKPVATGLWSRYGNPIIAPDSFLNQLPSVPLDGELWAGEGNFQLCRSICAGDEPDPRFDQIQFAVYSSPSLEQLFQDGEIKNTNMVGQIDQKIRIWIANQLNAHPDFKHSQAANFEEELTFLDWAIESQSDHVYLHRQTKLPGDPDEAKRAIESYMEGVLNRGGEGVMLRDPLMPWVPKRNSGILKYKPFDDAEATIVGFVTGRQGKQGNLLGKIGTLVCETKGPKGKVQFEIGTGMTFPERDFRNLSDFEWAMQNPESFTKAEGEHFRVGQQITFKYREWTDDGLPKEGRYFRPRDEE